MGAPPLLAALDVGGTKLGWAVGTAEGEVLAQGRAATDPAGDPRPQLEAALASLDALVAASGRGPAAALGAACPGPFLQPEGRFLEIPNLPGWQGFGLLEFLRERRAEPVAAMNDANAGVLAEWRWGAARGAHTAVFLTVSTGCGAGIVAGGRLIEGPQGFAGEVGHLRLAPDGPVGFGKRGSVEGYLSGPGLAQVARAEALACAQRGIATRLAEGEPTPERVGQLALEGDPAAVATMERCATKLGELCALLVDLLNPDVIVLGTIPSAFPDLFLPRAREVLAAEAIPQSAQHVRLVVSGLADRGNQSALAVAAQALEPG